MKDNDLKKFSRESFLTVKQFADMVKMHPNSIYKAIRKGRLQAFRITDSRQSAWRIPESEVNRIAIKDMDVILNKIITQRSR